MACGRGRGCQNREWGGTDWGGGREGERENWAETGRYSEGEREAEKEMREIGRQRCRGREGES